jgi:hypothetical protein
MEEEDDVELEEEEEEAKVDEDENEAGATEKRRVINKKVQNKM